MAKPFERIIALDFETAWGRGVKLGFSCQTNEEYIRDPRFKAWGLSYDFVDMNEAPWQDEDKIVNKAIWLSGDNLKRWLANVDWGTTAVLCQNTQFDGSILSWIYGVQPAFLFDTFSMGRALFGVDAGNSLKKLAERFSLPPKGDGLASSENILDTLPFEIERELAEYCKHDTWLCKQLFLRMVKNYPVKELKLIDMTLKMYTRPLLELDTDMLTDALLQEREQREGLLKKLSIDEGDLASNPKFAQVLRGIGIEPPMKKSKTTGEQTFAFAKNDAKFQALMNSDNEEVALLCEARLKTKSTTERTRAQRFLDIANRGKLPVPLTYFGAITGRWTAARGSAINMQNLKRGSFLRNAIMAPEGYMVAVADLSQIEPRVLAWLADYDDMLDVFRAKGDPYAQFGAQMFNIPGMTKESHPDLRQSAKSALLGCGYGLGWASFSAQLLVGFLGADPVRYDKPFAKKLGVDAGYVERFLDWEDNIKKMDEIARICTAQELLIHCVAAKKIIDVYRATAHPVVGLWELFGQLIERSLFNGEEYTHKCLTFRKGEIELPNGMKILYPDLRKEKGKDGRPQWVYGPDATKLYAGKITNNVVQGTARIIMTDGMLRTAQRFPIVGTVHDEQLVLVPEEGAQDSLTWCIEQMTMEPKYMPGIPLAADGGVHRRYGLAKK